MVLLYKTPSEGKGKRRKFSITVGKKGNFIFYNRNYLLKEKRIGVGGEAKGEGRAKTLGNKGEGGTQFPGRERQEEKGGLWRDWAGKDERSDPGLEARPGVSVGGAWTWRRKGSFPWKSFWESTSSDPTKKERTGQGNEQSRKRKGLIIRKWR